jgi:hypothetical protein
MGDLMELFEITEVIRCMGEIRLKLEACEGLATDLDGLKLEAERIIPHADRLSEILSDRGLELTAINAGRINYVANTLANGDLGNLSALREQWASTHCRLIDELNQCIVLLVRKEDAPLFVGDRDHFGAAVAARFPKATPDIAEAGRCLAASRWTACVVHLMRALEFVLKSIRANTKAKNAHDWGGLIKGINMALASRAASAGPQASSAQRARARFYKEAIERFDRIRDVRRNPASHAGKTFKEHEARAIYASTKDFMAYLADGWPSKKRSGSAPNHVI